MFAVIFAGGAGTRLWPVSRQNSPKQVQPFVDEQSLLQKTYQRVSRFFDPQNIYLATNENCQKLILEQIEIKPENFIIEPQKKDTAAALGLAAVKLFKKDPEAIMTNIWSDHYIKNEELYGQFLKIAEELVRKYPDKIILGGINPTYPETGYGYIKMGDPVEKVNGFELFKVAQFVEKPDLETAKSYLQQWEYLWNPAYFFFKAKLLLDLFAQFEPDMHASLMRIYQALETEEQEKVIKAEFEQIKKISIDYAIMEKCNNLLVLPLDLGWADVGNWKTVKDILSSTEEENVIKGKSINIDSKNNLIYSYSGKLIATIGIKNKIIIETPDAILVCDKDRAQEVKKIVEQLNEDTDLKIYS